MSTDTIVVRGARVHNLKNIDFEIPHNALTVVTGACGVAKFIWTKAMAGGGAGGGGLAVTAVAMFEYALRLPTASLARTR